MGNQTPLQAVVISQAAMTKHSSPVQLALFNQDGTPYDPTQAPDLEGYLEAEPAAFQADSVAADVAALVVDFNALLAKLQTAGLMAEE